MPIMRDMKLDYEAWTKNDPKGRIKFNFVVIPQAKDGKGFSEAEAVILCGFDTFGLDWDGGLKCSGLRKALWSAMECEFTECFPDADPMDPEPVGVLMPSKTSMHAIAMTGEKAKIQKPGANNIHENHFQWEYDRREGYFNYDVKTRKPEPLTPNHVRAVEQAFERQVNSPDLLTDKPGGHLFLKRHAKGREKFATFVGRVVKWELRAADPV